jgi:hypothetical protein
MAHRILKHRKFLPAAFVILSAAVFGVAQEPSGSKQNIRPEIAVPTAKPVTSPSKPIESNPARFSYEFTQPEFYVRRIFIEHDVSGRGQLTFQRLNEETPFLETLELSPAALSRITALWQALRFLDSEENYQSERQYPHLGTMRLTMEQGERKRTEEFNWTHNQAASQLANEYRRLADQVILIFDISVARANQPLNAPKLMEQLESMLKRNWLSDPEQLVPLLKDMSGDEHIPLIARNHAARLLKKIEK